MRLIDADALIEYIKSCDWKAETQTSEILRIQNAPTADAKEVKHAHWIHSQKAKAIWYCSARGEKITYNTTLRTYQKHKNPVHIVNAWCRKCGAKMDGGEST